MKRKWLLLLLVSLCLSLAAILYLGGLSQFRLLRRLTFGAALLLIMLKLTSWFFNALRTRFLLAFVGRQVGFLETAMLTISAEFAGVVTPGGVGMAATYAFLFNRMGVSLGRSFGLVGLIVLTDLAIYATIMPLAAFIQLLRWPATHQGLYLALLSLVIVAGGAYLFWLLVRHHRRLCSFVGVQMGKVPWLAWRRWRLARHMVEFLRAVRLLGRMPWSQRLALYLITLDFWLPRYLILLLVVDMVGQSVPATYLLLAQSVLHLTGQILALPGGAGTTEMGYVEFMGPFMGHEALGISLLIWRFFTFYWYLLVGAPFFLYNTGRAARDLLRKRPAPKLLRQQ